MKQFIFCWSVALVYVFASFHAEAKESTKRNRFTFGIPEVDMILKRDFIENEASYLVRVKSSGSIPERMLPLKDFLKTMKADLGCPKCSIDSGCRQDPKDEKQESCFIEFSAMPREQKPGQDMEPGSIWTLEYVRFKNLNPSVKKGSLSSTWRDF